MSDFYFHEETYRGCTIKIEPDDLDGSNPRELDNVGTMCVWCSRYRLGDEKLSEDLGDYLTALVPAIELQKFEDRTNRAYNNREVWGYTEGKRLDTATYDAIIEKIEEAQKKFIQEWIEENLVILDLFLYDHSGISMRTVAFSCPWDSGRVGFIYCTLETAQKEWGTPDSEEKGWAGEASYTLKADDSKYTLREAATNYLEGEVVTYEDYLTGKVGAMVTEDPNGDVIDSCGGYFPDHGVPYSQEWDYPISEAKSSIDYWCMKQEEEKQEAGHWADRGSMTDKIFSIIDRQNWNDNSLVDLLQDFVQLHHMEKELERFLSQRAQEENDK